MITRLEVENFYSVRERQVIDLTISGKVPIEDDPFPRFPPLHDGSPARAPRIVAFYGANASGKSNVLRAIAFLAWFMGYSFEKQPNQSLPYWKFLGAQKQAAPTRLAVQFTGPANLSDGSGSATYLYQLELGDWGEPAEWVQRESLHVRPQGRTHLSRIFERDARGQIKTGPQLQLGRERAVLEKILRPDASLIATLGQLNNTAANRLMVFAHAIRTNILVERFPDNDDALVRLYHKTPDLLDALIATIRRIDVGLDHVQTIMTDVGPVAEFFHTGLDVSLRLPLQSHGTQTFFRIFPLLHYALQTGGIAVVDEIDVAIHPGLLPEILRWFLDPDRNPHGAQLWMSCHAPSLMAELEKEEIWFCEKTLDGATQVHALAQVQGVRRDAAFAQNYLGGVYGGVPRIG